MHKTWSLLAIVLAAGLVLAGCGQISQAPAGTPTTAPETRPTVPVKAGPEQDWATIVANAKKEGKVNIYNSGWVAETRAGLTEGFKQRYGIEAEFMTFARSEEMIAKVQAEQRAGLYLADVFGGGVPALPFLMKDAGVLGPVKPLLILPEVLDGKAWRIGAVPYVDKDGYAIIIVDGLIRNLAYNTDMIKEGEITTLKDALKPQYKGKITLNDPTVSGAGNTTMAHLDVNFWGEAATFDFLRALVKTQEAVVQRDIRLQIETVARGKYAIAFSPSMKVVSQFIGLGSPLKFAVVEEDNRLTSSSGQIGVPNKLAHPDAAKLFVNWLLTQEGQSIFATTFGQPSPRLDASKKGIDPLLLPVPGKSYIMVTDEFTAAAEKWLDLSRKAIN